MYGFTDVKREFEFYQTLQHPNILTILEVSNNNHYLVSKYFARNLQQQSFCPKLFQRIIRNVLQAVHHLHTHGYIHNNIKPNKIFLDDTVVVLGWDCKASPRLVTPDLYVGVHVSGTASTFE
eukprot:PhF_6_TR16924/c3_g1_i3/m.25438